MLEKMQQIKPHLENVTLQGGKTSFWMNEKFKRCLFVTQRDGKRQGRQSKMTLLRGNDRRSYSYLYAIALHTCAKENTAQPDIK